VNRPASRRSGLVALVAVSLAVLLGGCQLGGDPSDDASGGLVGTAWVVREIAGTTTLADSRPTMAFGEDRSVTGSGGCNTYQGPYAVSGMEMAIGPLASTKMACESPAGDIEVTYLAALDAVGLWSIDDAGHLVLAGPTPLIFDRA
jgi:heat shock protein HslJ